MSDLPLFLRRQVDGDDFLITAWRPAESPQPGDRFAVRRPGKADAACKRVLEDHPFVAPVGAHQPQSGSPPRGLRRTDVRDGSAVGAPAGSIGVIGDLLPRAAKGG